MHVEGALWTLLWKYISSTWTFVAWRTNYTRMISVRTVISTWTFAHSRCQLSSLMTYHTLPTIGRSCFVLLPSSNFLLCPFTTSTPSTIDTNWTMISLIFVQARPKGHISLCAQLTVETRRAFSSRRGQLLKIANEANRARFRIYHGTLRTIGPLEAWKTAGLSSVRLIETWWTFTLILEIPVAHAVMTSRTLLYFEVFTEVTVGTFVGDLNWNVTLASSLRIALKTNTHQNACPTTYPSQI